MDRLWIGLTALSVAGIVLFGWLLRKRYKALQEWKKGYQPPQMRFQYSADELTAEYDDMGDREHLLMRQFSWIFVPMLFLCGHGAAGGYQKCRTVQLDGMDHVRSFHCRVPAWHGGNRAAGGGKNGCKVCACMFADQMDMLWYMGCGHVCRIVHSLHSPVKAKEWWVVYHF